jgi:hypothetical protein
MTSVFLELVPQFRAILRANTTAFWDTAPCSLVEVDRSFGDVYCLHHNGDETSTRLHGATSQKAIIF